MGVGPGWAWGQSPAISGGGAVSQAATPAGAAGAFWTVVFVLHTQAISFLNRFLSRASLRHPTWMTAEASA